MSTLKVNSIQHSNGTDALTIDSTGHATFNKTFIPANPLTNRNLIINGDMKIAQRGTSFVSQTSTAYHLDRWEVSAYNIESGVYRVYQDTDVPSGQGFVNSLRLDCTTANGTQNANEQVYLQQQIEAQNFNHLKYFTASPDTVTLSFWIKSNLTGTYAVQLKLSDNGSAENSTSTQVYRTTYTISASNTWEKKTVTIELDDNVTPTKSAGNVLGGAVSFWFGAGSSRQGRTADNWGANGNATTSADNLNILGSTSNDVWITGVQLEVGDTATPFEHRPYDMELARCQRYYYLHASSYAQSVGNGTMYTSALGYVFIHLPVTLRGDPALEITNLTAMRVFQSNGFASPTTITLWTSYSPNVAALRIAVSRSIGSVFMDTGGSGDNRIAFDAEL